MLVLELVRSNCRKKRKLNASELFWHLPPFQPVVQDECGPPKPSQAKTSRAAEGLPHLSSWQSSQTVYSSPHGLNVPVHVEGSPEHINGPLAGLLPSHLVQPPGGLAAPSTPSAPSPAGMTAHARRCSLRTSHTLTCDHIPIIRSPSSFPKLEGNVTLLQLRIRSFFVILFMHVALPDPDLGSASFSYIFIQAARSATF